MRRSLRAACLAVTVPLAVPAVVASQPVRHERELRLERVHLGLSTHGSVGIHIAYGPRRPSRLTSISVAIGARPRMVYGFVGDQLGSPLQQRFPNASHRRAGVRYRVIVTFCRSAPGTAARAAKLACDERTAITTHAYLHHRFAPPA